MTQQTYYPHPKLKPIASYASSVRGRIMIERRICRRLVRDLKAAGYDLQVTSTDEWETPPKATTDQLMRAMFNLDDCWIVVTKGEEDHGWVRLVFGNDGWDVISDYTTNLEPVMEGVNVWAERFAE